MRCVVHMVVLKTDKKALIACYLTWLLEKPAINYFLGPPCNPQQNQPMLKDPESIWSRQITMTQTSLVRFAVDLLYNKSTTNRTSGVRVFSYTVRWRLRGWWITRHRSVVMVAAEKEVTRERRERRWSAASWHWVDGRVWSVPAADGSTCHRPVPAQSSQHSTSASGWPSPSGWPAESRRAASHTSSEPVSSAERSPGYEPRSCSPVHHTALSIQSHTPR